MMMMMMLMMMERNETEDRAGELGKVSLIPPPTAKFCVVNDKIMQKSR